MFGRVFFLPYFSVSVRGDMQLLEEAVCFSFLSNFHSQFVSLFTDFCTYINTYTHTRLSYIITMFTHITQAGMRADTHMYTPAVLYQLFSTIGIQKNIMNIKNVHRHKHEDKHKITTKSLISISTSSSTVQYTLKTMPSITPDHQFAFAKQQHSQLLPPQSCLFYNKLSPIRPH